MLGYLYNWAPMREFVAAALGKDEPRLHADHMGAMIMFIYDEGDESGWHFDHASLATTIVLRQLEVGGEFEYVHRVCKPDDENHPGIVRVVLGSDEDVIRLPGGTGTLNLFVGHYSIHRVTPVEGPRPRMVAVPGYR